jgi:hypothetical protein
MKIEGFSDQVVVQDTTATDDRRGNSMSTTLEQTEIDALPDDPDELQDYLTQLAGGAGAIFQVNGFRGGRLPTRDEIRQIRIRTNSFSADNHDAGRTQIEIITKPNVRDWSGNANMQYRSDALNARNAFSPTKTPEQNRQFNLGLRGPIVKNRTSIRLNVDGRRDVQSDTIRALNVDGTPFGLGVQKPSDQTNVTVGVEHGVNANQTLRLEVRGGNNKSENQGVGGFNYPERGTTRSGDNYSVRAQLQGVIGKNALNELHLQYTGQNSETTSVSQAAAIVVQDAFSRGGAGANSTNSSHGLELADNFDFNVGKKQQMRVGALLEGGTYKYFDQSNANGTFTFQSLDAYNAILAGTPLLDQNGSPLLPTYKIRIGTVNTDFNVWQLGFYWQDDIRVNNKFSYSLGVRNEMQSLLSDKLNVMPRLGFTFTPKGNKTAIRGGYGIFYDWYDSGLYDQTLRVNGVSQKDTLVLGAGYPDPFTSDFLTTPDVQPGGRIQASPDLKMPITHQASIGIERQVTTNLSVQVTYQMLRSRDQMRSINLNQPFISGETVDFRGDVVPVYSRPDESVGNITQFESTGRSNSDRYTFNYNYRLPRFNNFFGGNYTLGFAKNDTDSATSLPVDSNNLAAEWGIARSDVRHRLQTQFNFPLVYGVRLNGNVNAQSASPYNITTGLDTNKDGVFNERPDGVARNTARGTGTWTMNLRLQKQFNIGALPTGGSPQVFQQRGNGGGGRGGGFNGNNGTASRYNVELFVSADNVFNHVNYGGYSGNQLSKLFGKPTSAQTARRIQVGMGFRF